MAQLERDRETQAQTPAENSEKLQGSILFPCFNSKFTELIVNNTPVFFPSMWTYICIYEIGYCYEDRR